MARKRNTPQKETYYAWTELRNGGEAEKISVAGGRGERFVVKSRNIINQGEEVSQSDLGGIDDATWQQWIDSGAIRTYPLPEGVDEYTSPTQAFLKNVTTGSGEVDVDKLMELGLSHPAGGAYAEDEVEDVDVDEDEDIVTAPSGA